MLGFTIPLQSDKRLKRWQHFKKNQRQGGWLKKRNSGVVLFISHLCTNLLGNREGKIFDCWLNSLGVPLVKHVE